MSSGTNVEVILSEDDIITPSDALAGYASLGHLYPGQCAVLGVQTSAGVPDGAYTLGAVVDSFGDVIELSETNNAAAGGDIGIGDGPDLIVSAVSGPPSAFPGGGFNVQVTVCNQGTAPNQTGIVDVRLSPDATIEPFDPLLGSAPVPWLYSGQCEPVTVAVSADVPEGAYHLGAIARENGWNQELITSNNTRDGGLLGVGHRADLVVSAVSGPPGSLFDASITVCNQGTAPSHGVTVEVRLSPDATITTADVIAGGTWLPSLDVGQCESLVVPTDAYVPVGTYTLGAVVDAYDGVPELLESNNATAGGELLVAF
ncbi:CARDB domain-containing protein [Sorangium sp. So ce362]|uniref:CARDB domain-containing protein n=1 Tax=Sorangium sp. So ce362 TaxID=3133303 RepID=UPI003F615C2E